MKGYRTPSEREKDSPTSEPKINLSIHSRQPEEGRFRCAICNKTLTPEMDWSHIQDYSGIIPYFWVFCKEAHLGDFQTKVMSNFASVSPATIKKACERAYHMSHFATWMATFKKKQRGGNE